MKNILITGGNSGIGFETAKQLASRGHCVIITVRDEAKGKKALSRIRSYCDISRVSYVTVDLSEFDSIKMGANQILSSFPQIDVLIHNAGNISSNRHTNKDGIELTFMVNHVAPFYLTSLLLPSLINSDDARIINVSSDSHFMASFDAQNLNLDKGYQCLKAYARSKLANMLFTYEFERRNPHSSISIFAVNPGLVNTDIGAKQTNFFHRLLWKWCSRFGKSHQEGADASVFLATSDRENLISGTYWEECSIKKSSKTSYDEEYARLLWKKSMEICDMECYF